jgi:transposase, IS30 family
MNNYKHIEKYERLEISILLRKGYSDRDIALELGRSRSTIYRERIRNTVSGEYIGSKAQQKAYVRRKYSKYQAMRIIRDMKLRDYIDTHLRLEWSPEQIAGRLAHEAGLQKVSAPTIYKYIRSPYGRQLEYELDLAKKKRTKKSQRKVTSLEDRIFIDKRPQAANVRAQYGHWEGDFIVGGKKYPKASLLVLHERVSRYTYVRKISARTAKQVEDTLATAVRELGSFKSLTLDNDIAFRKHTKLSEDLKAPIYFCQPYHSWEKGGVENANRLIRRFVPKGCNIARFTHKDIAYVEHWINTVPRKVLDYNTAEEVMNQYRTEAYNA